MKYAPAIIILSVFLFSCGNSNKPPGDTVKATNDGFSLPPDYAQRSVKTLEYDANHDGHNDALVLLQDSSHAQIHSDSLILYLYNKSEKNYLRVSTVAVENAAELQVQQIDGDSIPELLVSTEGGGTSETASKGMIIFKLKDVAYQSYQDIPFGAPEFVRIDSVPALLLYENYSGFFSRSESAKYLDSMIILAPLPPQQSTSIRDNYFRMREQRLLKEVDSLIRHPQSSEAYAQDVFSKVVNRVMLLRKFRRDRETEEFIRWVNKKARALPKRYKEALEEVTMDMS